MFHVADYSTTRELQGPRHNKLPRATIEGPVAFAIESKPTAATVVDLVSPAGLAPG